MGTWHLQKIGITGFTDIVNYRPIAIPRINKIRQHKVMLEMEMPADHKSQAKYHSNTDSQLLIPEN